MAQSESDQLDFQTELYKFYLGKVEAFLNDANGREVDCVIADRSPFDVIAWTVYKSQTLVTLEMIDNMYDQAIDLINTFDIEVVFFPYPQDWSQNEGCSDSFRQDYPGKNLLINGLLHNLIFDKADLDDVSVTYLTASSVDERVLNIVNHTVEDEPLDEENLDLFEVAHMDAIERHHQATDDQASDDTFALRAEDDDK